MKSLSFEKKLIGVQKDLQLLAYRLTNNEEEASDLVQETSLRALSYEDAFTENTNFKGWMKTIMRNIFINNYRKVVSGQPIVRQNQEDLYHIEIPLEAAENIEKIYDLKEIHHAFNLLPQQYKTPFAMHVAGFKYKEIAEKLNLPIGTVKSRIYATRQKLQKDLKDFR